MALENILSQEIVQKLGWTLLHFVWQAAAVGLLVGILLALLQKSSANLRYIIACTALGLIVLLPIATMQLVPVSAPQPIANIEPAPAPAILLAQEIREIPAVEMTIPEEPVQHENTGTAFNASWKQRAADLLEPALPYIVSAWLLGVFGLSLWHLGGWAQLQRLRKKMVKQVDDSLHTKLRRLSEKLRVKRAVQLAESALVQVPTVVGWLRPVILLPASALTGLSTEQLEALLAHELAHIRRYDYLVNMLQTVVETLGFYHPAVWWISHKIRAERENCCDDLAVSISGDRIRYARALASMEEIRRKRGELAVAASGGNLFGRIRRLVAADSSENHHLSWVPSAITVMLIVALALPTTLALSRRSSNGSHESQSSLLEKLADPKVNAEGQQILKQMAEINRYWLIAPSPKVENYSYDFNLYDWDSNEPIREAIKVKRPARVNSKWRQGITYNSVLHKLISDPSSTIIRKIRKDRQLIQLDFIFRDFTEIECGNGISHSWRGYFSGQVKTGSLWLDAKKIIPVKVKAGWLVEYFSEYVATDESHYVPLKITVGNDINLYHWKFGFYEPGLWLFENATYRQDEESQPRMAASINNLKINQRTAVKTKIPVVEVPELNESREVKVRKTSKPRKSVTLTLTEQGMSFEGQTITLDQFGSLLADVPEPENTGLKLVLAADSFSSEKLNDVKTRISILSRELGFKYLSCISEGTSTLEKPCEEYFFTAPLEFNRDIYIRQNATGQFKQKYYRSEKGWGTDETGQHKELATVYANSIKFQKSLFRGNVSAKLKIAYASWPKAKWQIIVRLLDDKGKRLAQASSVHNTGGYIRSGIPLYFSSELDFSFGRDEKLSKAAAFEIAITPLPENESNLNDLSAIPDETFQLSDTTEQEQLDRILEKYADGSSADESGNDSKSVCESVESYIAAALAGNDEKAAEYAYPDTAVAAQTKDMREILQGQDAKIVAACIGEWNSLAISSVIQADGRTCSVIFHLKKIILDQKVNWLIDDIDLETLDTIGKQIQYFINNVPDAKTIIINPDTHANIQTDAAVENDEGRIEGRIIDINTGKGISGVQLAAVPDSSPESNERFACTSAEDGTFAIGGLQSGEYLLQGDFPSVDVDVVSGRCTNDVLIGVSRGETVPAPKETTAEQQGGGQIMLDVNLIKIPADTIKNIFEPNESLTSELLVRNGYEIAGRLLRLRQELKDAQQIANPQVLMLNNDNSAITITKEEFFIRHYEPIEGEPGKFAPQLQHLEVGWKFKIHAKIIESGEKVHIELATRQQGPDFETRQYRPGYDYQIPVRPEIFVTEFTAKNGEPVVICRLKRGEPTFFLIVTPSALVPEPLPEPLLGKKLPEPDNIRNIDDFKQAEGKPTLICFWDMNQRPSRNLVSELAKREKELSEKDVAVYLVHTSNVEPAKLKQWLDSSKTPFACGNIEGDAEEVLFNWGVWAQPWLILTDQEGVVRAEGFNIEQLDEKLHANGTNDVLNRAEGANFAGNSRPGESADKPQEKTDDQRKAEVFGRVSQDDRNVVWARVIAHIRSDQTSKQDSRPPALNTRTDENGLYRFADLPAGRYSISVMSPKGNLNMAQKQINLELGYRTELNFGDEEGFTLTGVVTVDGEAVEIASVRIPLPNESIKWDWTDRNGKFRITGIPSGQYRLFTTYDKDLDPVTFTWGQIYDTRFDKRQITIENDLSVDINLEEQRSRDNLPTEESAINNPRDPMLIKSAAPSMEDKTIVRIDLSVVEVFPDLKMDRETTIAARNLLGPTFGSSTDAVDLLRKAADTTAAIEGESGSDKRVTQEMFKVLVDMMTSKGYMKILLRPTLEVVDGQAAIIKANQDSIQITPNVLENGKIDLQFEAALSSESIRRDDEQTPIINKLEISTQIRLSPGESGIISGMKQAGLLTEPDKAAKELEVPASEILVILTPTIVDTAGNQLNGIDVKDEATVNKEYEVVLIRYADAMEVAEYINKALQQMLEKDLRESVHIQPLERTRQIIIFGRPDMRQMVKKLIAEIDMQVEHSKKLSKLGKALLIYTNDHNDKYPDSLAQVKPYLKTEEFAWAQQNVTYYGKGRTVADPPDMWLARDNRQAVATKGTNILFNDGRVEFIKPGRQKDRGTDKDQIMIDIKILTVSDEFMKYIGLDPNSAASSEDWADYLVHASDDSASFVVDQLHEDLLLRVVAARMSTHKDIQMLHKPQVLAMAGKKFEIHITDSEHFMLIAPVEPNGSSVESESKSNRIELGTTVRLTPNLTPDRKNVELDFEWEYRRLQGIREQTGPDGKVQKIPIVDVDRIKTPCTVPDGKTLLITGKKIIEQKKEPKKPRLSDLPLIGGLFSSPTKTEETKYLLIMVKPVINPPKKAPPKPQPIDPNDPLVIKLEEKFKHSDEKSGFSPP